MLRHPVCKILINAYMKSHQLICDIKIQDSVSQCSGHYLHSYINDHQIGMLESLLHRETIGCQELQRMLRRIYGNMSLAISSAAEDLRRCLKANRRNP